MVTVEDLEEQARQAGIRIAEIPLKDGLMGYYAPDKKLIVLSAALSARQKRSALAHELQHALNKDQGCGGRCGALEERHAREKTALTLINLADFKAAEYAYEGDTYLMSRDLEVTTQVLNDCRKIIARLAQQQADNTYIKL